MRFIKKCGLGIWVVCLATVLLSQENVFQIQNITPFWYAAVECKGSYDQHASAFQTLYSEAGRQGIRPGIPFGIYYNSLATAQEAELQWEVGFALNDSMAVQAPLVLKKWAFPTIATVFYKGSFSDTTLSQLYQKLFVWIGEKGYELCGPFMEKFLAPPSPNEKGELVLQSQIMVPVRELLK